MTINDKGDKNFHNNTLEILFRYAVGVICVAFVFFQLYTAGFGAYPTLIQRSIHAAFGVGLAFLILPTFARSTMSKGASGLPSLFNVILSIVYVGLCLYIVFNYDRLMTGIGVAGQTHEYIMGILLILLTMEAARRSTGVILPILSAVLIFYAYMGDSIPGYFGHRGFGIDYIIEYLYLGPEGIWGQLTGISATLVAAFIIFGAILLSTGGADAFMKIAIFLGGRSRGGAGKVALVGSGLFGMLSGSAIANVATTGNFTIPMMKRLKYPAHFAGGVEATASSGGQITPPIMGAGAFIMAELTGIQYTTIIIAAALPALLFYICVWVSIDLEARKKELALISPEDIPSAKEVFNWKLTGPVLVTLAVLLGALFMGFSPARAAFVAVITNLGLFLFVNPLNKEDFIERCRKVYAGIESAGRAMITVVCLLICAQIAIAVISLTGIGIKMSQLIIGVGAGHLLLSLILAAVVSLILGMGIPTTAAYVLAASVIAPALSMLGVDQLPAHMFIFYCALLSGLTPPVCTAVYTAASIANANWLSVAWVSIRLALMKYILPFFFIYRPEILMIGSWYAISRTILITIISANLIAIGTVGFYRRNMNVPVRLIAIGIGVMLIYPGFYYDILGLTLFIVLAGWERIREKQRHTATI